MKPFNRIAYLRNLENPRAQEPRLNASAILVWRRLPPTTPFGKHSTIAISFFICTIPPFSIIDFASFLLYIISTFGCHRSPEHRIFSHIGYAIRPDGICGLLLCTPAIEGAYQKILTNSRRHPSLHTVNGWPISTWPPNIRSI